MPTSQRLGATFLSEGQASPELTLNDWLTMLDAMSNSAVVIDKDLTAPPGSPTNGDRYIVASSPTGAWSGSADRIAIYNNGWYFIVPKEGMRAYVEDENTHYLYNGSWAADSGAALPAGMIVMWSGTIATIPSGWVLCDGTSGSPDLRNRFVVCANADSGGAAKSTISGVAAQTGGSSSHSHVVTGSTAADGNFDASTVDVCPQGAPTDSASHIPPWYALAYIMKT